MFGSVFLGRKKPRRTHEPPGFSFGGTNQGTSGRVAHANLLQIQTVERVEKDAKFSTKRPERRTDGESSLKSLRAAGAGAGMRG